LDSTLHSEFGDLLRDQKQKTRAAEEYAMAITLRPDQIDARIALAKLMLEVGNLQGAQVQLVSAARIRPDYPPLMDAAKEWDKAVREREASTRPSTTQSTTQTVTTQSASSGTVAK